MNSIAAVAFDLDGTLVDSAGGVAHALNVALQAHQFAPFPVERVRAWIGDGPDVLIGHAMRASGCPESEQFDLMPALRRGFDRATLADPMAGSHVFDGIQAMLDAVGRTRPMVVVTNKPTELARAVLKSAGLIDRFAHVLGADEAAQRKPSAYLLRSAADRLGVAPTALLMVGDAPPDAGAARAAGCAMAWAAWGYGRDIPETAWRLATPADLPRCLSPAREEQCRQEH